MKQINAAAVLRVVRDGKAMDLDGLTAIFVGAPSTGVRPVVSSEPPRLRARYDLHYVLEQLGEAGLVVLGRPGLDHKDDDYGISNVEVTLAPNWPLIQRTLGLSLSELADRQAGTVEVDPHFGPPEPITPSPDVFVLMPFEDKYRPIYVEHILGVTRSLKLVAMRADDFFTANHVMSDVWRGIYFARVIIADCTTRNPNVFYEIGVAHTLGRPVILITQNREDVPFDLRDIRFITYEYTLPGMRSFESTLASTLREELDMDRVE